VRPLALPSSLGVMTVPAAPAGGAFRPRLVPLEIPSFFIVSLSHQFLAACIEY
jgi:hypothetical protein